VNPPHVLASLATSLDGFLDDATDARLVLSGPADLDRVDAERAGVDAILVGAGTIRADDPRLLVRSAARRVARVAAGLPANPIKVALTRSGDLDPWASFFTAGDAERLVYAPPGVGAHLAGVATVVPSSLAPADVLADLAGRGIVRLMVEGGASVLRAFLDAGLVDELQRVLAPFFVGAGPRFGGAGTPHLVETRALGPDVLLRHRFGDADDRWLAEACGLAERCPPSDRAFSVGCVVVAGSGEVLATGWSRRDDPVDHAEEAALRDVDPADPRLADATVYCSLEPCGQRASRPRTCVDHILAAGVPRVVMARREPPTFVGAPSGAARLEAAGVEVVEHPRWASLARRPNRARVGNSRRGNPAAT
jgi:riboflavin-specific deaminase-like protein